MDDKNLITNKLFELANRAYDRNIKTNSNFLNLYEQSFYYKIEKKLSFISHTIYGGESDSERKVVFFNNEDNDFSEIVCIKIKPKDIRYSDSLTHRDFLGAIMNLGINESFVGDLYVFENTCFVFCLKSISNLILNLNKIKRTSVSAEIVNYSNLSLKHNFKIKTFSSSSSRVDAIISKLYNISRNEAVFAVQNHLIFINDKECLSQGDKLNVGDIVSFKTKGKFVYFNEIAKSDKLSITIKIYS
jgi:RNA-binding protein YlmH